MAESIHQEITLNASPEHVFTAYTDSTQHAGFTGRDAEINAESGASFSCHNGMIEGRNIEIVPNKRIVQAWRVANWDEGAYSIVNIDLEGQDSGTKVTLTHVGFPEGQKVHLEGGWHENYWKPMANYFSKK